MKSLFSLNFKTATIDEFNEYLKNGADINEHDGQIRTPLMAAAQETTNIAIIDKFHELGVNFNSHDINGVSPFLHACSFNPSPIIIQKIADFSLNIFEQFEKNYGANGLMLACMYNKKIEVIEYLLKHGFNVNEQSRKSKNTALMYAIMNRNIEVALLLINYGADINIQNQQEDYAIDIAQKVNFPNFINILLHKKQTEANLNQIENEKRNQIKQYAQKRNISCLVHFTRVENLKNILRYGLLSLGDLHQGNIAFIKSDEHRLDNDYHAICCSICFPNYQMLCKKRNKTDLNWVILVLKPDILWDKKCKFFEDNAASHGIIGGTDIFYLQQMFESKKQYRSSKIPAKYPSNPQAEILVQEHIDTKYIEVIVSAIYSESIQNLANQYNICYKHSLAPFEPRIDWEEWTPKKHHS